MIVDLIDAENWSAMGAGVKGKVYEGLLDERPGAEVHAGLSSRP